MATNPGKVPAKWVRNPSDRLAIGQGCTFDEAAGDRVIRFLETFCCQSQGEWAGKPLIVLDWQRDLLKRLYGWRRADGTRRFRTCYVEVPKKNGKSTLVSGLALYHLIADDEPSGQCYINAFDRAQAGIIFDEAEKMVGASPSLRKILRVIPSDKRIVHPGSHSFLTALSKEVASKDGLNASFTVFDELHRQATPAMWDIFEFAGAARRQPLLLAITTAGHDRNSICYTQHRYAEKVNAGKVEDTTFLGVIYGVDLADERRDLVDVVRDRKVWYRANPSMGVTIQEDDFAVEVEKALETPTKLNNFLRLRLNIWTNAANRFLPREAWDACGKEPVDRASLEGRRCYAGLDLSSTLDVTALALVFPDDQGGYDVLMWFWIPQDTAEIREKKDRVPYVTWARQDLVETTPGNVVDYEFIRETIHQLASEFDVRKVFADSWNATQLCLQLQGDGIPVEFIQQGFKSLSGPTKELERLVIARRIRHGANPVLDWMADNAMAVSDKAGNIKLDKGRGSEKIDGLAALVNALAAAINDGESDGESVYDSRGILLL